MSSHVDCILFEPYFVQAHRSAVRRLGKRSRTARRYHRQQRLLASGKLDAAQAQAFEFDEDGVLIEVTSDEEDDDLLGDGYNAVTLNGAAVSGGSASVTAGGDGKGARQG
jgi:hypothetical protein